MIESSFRISGPDAYEVNRDVRRCLFFLARKSPKSSRTLREGLSAHTSVTNALKYVIRQSKKKPAPIPKNRRPRPDREIPGACATLPF